VYDLAGSAVYEHTFDGLAGQQTLHWDGVNQHGARVAPGLYLLKINVRGDAGDESLQQLISVAY
jgi:flagellar hook assembly protein FlgD